MRARKLRKVAWGKLIKLDQGERLQYYAKLCQEADEVAECAMEAGDLMVVLHAIDRRQRVLAGFREEDKHVGNQDTELIEQLTAENEELTRQLHGSRAAKLAPPTGAETGAGPTS